jgi:carboxymethylenebutenolidase
MAAVQIPLAAAMPASLAVPEGEGPWPGVVVLSDIMGMTSDLRNQADWLASEGYLAAAPDLFFRGNRASCLKTLFQDLRSGKGRTYDDVDAVRRFLVDRSDCTGRVGVIGFCLGGGFALQLVSNHGFAVSAPNYGMLPKDLDAFLADACPVVASYGAKDRPLRGAAAKLDAALSKAGVPHDVKEYPDAGHSFLNDHDPAELGVIARTLFKAGGSVYHEPSATDARARILAFFDEHLRRPAG